MNDKSSSFIQKANEWQKKHPKITFILCALIVLPYAYYKISRSLEKPIDVRAFYFPSKSISYELMNKKDSSDKFSISVQVKAIENNDFKEGIIILKKFPEIDVEETYFVAENMIVKSSHKVQGIEQMKEPVRFNRFIKTDEVFGPIKDKFFHKTDGHDSVGQCYVFTKGFKEGLEVVGKKTIRVVVKDEENPLRGFEDYCEGIGQVTMIPDYVINPESLKGFCNKFETTTGELVNIKCTPNF